MKNKTQLTPTLHYGKMKTAMRPDGFWAIVATNSGTVQWTFNTEASLLKYYAEIH